MKATRSNKPLLFFTFATLTLFLVGCAVSPNIPISTQNLNAVRSITIDPVIVHPEMPHFDGKIGHGQIIAQALIVPYTPTISSARTFKDYLEKNKIHITEIVYASFKEAILEDNIFQLESDSEMTLKLKINVYGFGRFAAFQLDKRKPMLNVTAALVSKDTKIIWRKSGFSPGPNTKVEEYTFEQITTDPGITRKAFEKHTLGITRRILTDLKQQ